MNESWTGLLAGSLDHAATQKLLRNGLADLDRALQTQPHADEDIVSIVEKNLALPWDEGTITTLGDALASYIRSDAGQIFIWVGYDRTNRLQQLSTFDNSPALDLVRRVSTTYARPLQRAIQVSNGWRDDWDWISYTVGYDQGNSIYRLRFDLTKMTGDRIRIESPPDNLMVLCTYLLSMLRDVGARDAFSESVRRDFGDRVKEVQKVLGGEPGAVAVAPAARAPGKP